VDDSPSPDDSDGSWDMTLPDLSRKVDPRERPVTCQGEDTTVYCDRDGSFQRATCVYTPCPEFSEPVRHYCYDEDDEPVLLEAFEDEETGDPVPFDERDSGMLAAAKAECLDDEDNRWVGDFGAEEGCECIPNYVVDREQCWAGIPPFRAPLGRMKWDLQAQDWDGKCEGEWEIAARARGCLFDAVAVVTLLLLPLSGAAVYQYKRHQRKKREREAAYKRERKELLKQEEIDRLAQAAQDKLQKAERMEQEKLMLSNMAPEAAEEWWRNHDAELKQQKQNRKRARGHWMDATSKAVWRNNKGAGARKGPDKILYNWQGEVGAHRGSGSLASAKILYGEAWKSMEPEEKKLILYRLDTEYSRPTSTEAWQKPMGAKGALPESPRGDGERQTGRAGGAASTRGGKGGGGGRSAKVAPVGTAPGKKTLPALTNGTGKKSQRKQGRGGGQAGGGKAQQQQGEVGVGETAAGFFAAGGEHPDAWAIEDVQSSP